MRKRKSEGWMSRMSADGVKQRTKAVSARVWLTDPGSAALHPTDTLTSLTSGTSPNNWQNKLLFNTAAPATFPCQAARTCWKADGSAVSQPWGFFLLSAAPHYDECCRCKLHYTSMSASSHLEQPRLCYPWHFPCFQTPSSSSLLSKRLDMMQVHIFSIRGCADRIFYLFSFWLEHFLSLFLFILCSSDFRFICTGFSFFSPLFGYPLLWDASTWATRKAENFAGSSASSKGNSRFWFFMEQQASDMCHPSTQWGGKGDAALQEVECD